MICETYNWFMNVWYWCFGSVRQPKSEVSAIDFISFFVLFIVFVFVISWWLVPLMKGIDKLSDIKFRCGTSKN